MFNQLARRENYIFDVGESSIVSGVPMRMQRAAATSAQVGSIIYVFGGSDGPFNQVRMNSCEKLDTSKSPMNWERIASMESGKGDAGAVVADGKIMVVGGFSGKGFLSSVEIYNPLTNTWQRGPSLQAPRSGMGLAVLHGVVYIAGGNRGTGRLCSVERLERFFSSGVVGWGHGGTLEFVALLFWEVLSSVTKYGLLSGGM